MCLFPAPHWHLLAQGSFSSIDADHRTRRWRLGLLLRKNLVDPSMSYMPLASARVQNAVAAQIAAKPGARRAAGWHLSCGQVLSSFCLRAARLD